MLTSRTHNHATNIFGEGFMIYQGGGARIGKAYFAFDQCSFSVKKGILVIYVLRQIK